jgi:hypothetical protein
MLLSAKLTFDVVALSPLISQDSFVQSSELLISVDAEAAPIPSKFVPVNARTPVDTLYATLVIVDVGGAASITKALLSARLLPDGNVVDVIALP